MINKDLKEYIETCILPLYDNNDEGHTKKHIQYVIERSLQFAKEVDSISMDMVYTVAAYHDIEIAKDRENHEKLSALYLEHDGKLREFFTDEEIKIMSEAIEDHRASKKDEPRSIYGKIVSTADRNTQIELPFQRTFYYRKDSNDKLDVIIEKARKHLQEKYGKNGYAVHKSYFKDVTYEEYLKKLDSILKDKGLFKEMFLSVNRIDEKAYELNRVRKLCKIVGELAREFDVEYFFVTEGASCCHIQKNDAVRYHRKLQIDWERKNGFDPNEDWNKENKK